MKSQKMGFVKQSLKTFITVFLTFFCSIVASEVRPVFIPIAVGDITTFIPLLPAPSSVSSSSSGANTYTLSWSAVGGASYYQVVIHDENRRQTSRKVEDLSYVLSGLPLGESRVTILACNEQHQCGAPGEVGKYNVSERVTYIHTDMLGSPTLKTDLAGNAVAKYHYKPFGDTQEAKGEELGYTGHLEDTDLNLTYMQARYYDPVVGRFYSNDPVDALEHLNHGNIQGFNRYAYANNNPYKYTDPTGEVPVIIVARIAVAACSANAQCRKAAADAATFVVEQALDIWLEPDTEGPAGGSGKKRRNQKKFKEKVWENNKNKNGGTAKCEGCGKEVVPGTKLKKGDKVPDNRGDADHKDRIADGGPDDADTNGQLLCNPCHIEKTRQENSN